MNARNAANIIFPIILFVLLCVAIIAVATAPRSAVPGTEPETEERASAPDEADEAEDGGDHTGMPKPPEPVQAAENETEPAETDPEPAATGTEPAEQSGPDMPAEEEPDAPAEPETDAEAQPEDPVNQPEQTEPEEPAEPEQPAEPEEPKEPDAGSEEQENGDPGADTPPFDTHPFDGSEHPEEEKEPDPADEPEQTSVPAADPSPALSAFSPEVQAQIAAMSTRDLLTQMFIATYDGSQATAGYAAEYGFGGYITFAEDYVDDTPESFREGVDRVAAASPIPPFIAVDEEGGTVTRASKYSWYRKYPFLSPREVYEWNGIDGIRSDAAEKADLLKKLGVNYNLAPVADISVNTSDYMYNRSPGQDAETTSQIVETIVGVFNARGVASTVKHFPGYGAVSDTHVALAYDGRSVAELEAFDLIPFQRAMNAGVPSVMVSHIITALDPERPASVSSKVVDYIRSNMGYDGVLITDDMRMNGILDFCTSGNGSLEAILAGYDLICCTNWPEQFPVVWAAVDDGTLTRERLEISAARILRMKQDLGIWNP